MVNGCWAIGHRWLYMHPVGPKPNAQELHHEREKPRCVRPGHLRPLVPAGHRYVTALVNWMFTIAPNGKLAIDNVTRSQRERRYAETYRLPSDKALAVEGVASHHKKLPNCPSREALGRPIPSVRWGGEGPPSPFQAAVADNSHHEGPAGRYEADRLREFARGAREVDGVEQ